MPVNIIDTLKPKNGGSFPIVEAIDVFVDGFDNLADAVSHFATDVMIEAINTVLSGKANTSDVNTAVANLQGQINQIVISASSEAVVAPEVAGARVGEDGTEYATLKERLDAENTEVSSSVSNLYEITNVVLEQGAIYAGADGASANYIRCIGYLEGYAIVFNNQTEKTLAVSMYRYSSPSVDGYIEATDLPLISSGNKYIYYIQQGDYVRFRIGYGVSSAIVPSDCAGMVKKEVSKIDTLSASLEQYDFDTTESEANRSNDLLTGENLFYNGIADYRKYVNALGELVLDSSFSSGTGNITCAPIDVTDISTIYIRALVNVTVISGSYGFWLAYCFYDSNDALVGSRTVVSTSTTGLTEKYVTVSVPNEAKKMRISLRFNAYGLIRVSKSEIPYSLIPSISDSLSVSEKLSYKIRYIDGYVSSSGQIGTMSEEIESVYQNKTSDMLPVIPGQKYKFIHGYPSAADAWQAVFYYKSNLTSIERVAKTEIDFTAGENKYIIQEFTIPNECAYLRISSRTFGNKFSVLINEESTEDSIIKLIEDISSNSSGETVDILPDLPDEAIAYSQLYNSANKNDSFLFFTDQHLMGTNGSYDRNLVNSYMNVVKHYFSCVPFDFAINCGDWLNNGDTPNEAKKKLMAVATTLKNTFGDKCYNVIGNHDYNYLGEEVEGVKELSAQNIANILNRNTGKNYYIIERTAGGRYYVFDTYKDSEPGMSDYKWEQLEWFCQSLIADDKADNAVIMHIYYLNSETVNTFAKWLGRICYAYNTRGTATYINGHSYDFSNCTGHFDFVLVGHSHEDFVTTLQRNEEETETDIPVIGFANLQNGGIPTFDMAYVDYVNKKINLIRVGSGIDREVTF